MPKVLELSDTQRAWAEAHRCVICNAFPVKVENEQIEEHRQLRPEYRYLAQHGLPAESWQTEYIGGEYRCTVECENGHTFTGYYHTFKGEK